MSRSVLCRVYLSLLLALGVNYSAMAQSYSSPCGGSATNTCDCTNRYICDNGNCSCQGDQYCADTCSSNEVIAKPTAEQVLFYSDALKRTSSADKKMAAEALQKWMNGSLTMKEAVQYKNQLKLDVSQRPTVAGKPKSGMKIMSSDSAACLACIAGCCHWFGCNPACEAACALGACK